MRRCTTAGFLVAGLFLMGAADASAQTWGRAPTPSTGACFYEDVNFAGQYFCAPIGATNARVPRGTNDRISSIRVFGNADVTVFRDNGFEGPSRRFDDNMKDLRRAGWNDRISSFRISPRGFGGGGNFGGDGGGAGRGGNRRPDGIGLEVFADIGFRGRSAMFSSNTPDVQSTGMAGQISSLRVPSGETWQVCTQSDYRGRCQVVTGDVSDLRRGDWNDVIASARRLR
jgi:hypothetical protein